MNIDDIYGRFVRGSTGVWVILFALGARGAPVDTPGFAAGALFRDGPTHIRQQYVDDHPELCTTDSRLIFNGALYVSPDHVAPRSVGFFHNYQPASILSEADNGFSLVFEFLPGVEVTAGAYAESVPLGPKRFPQVESIYVDGQLGYRYRLAVNWLQNAPGTCRYMVYFKTTLPAGRTARGYFYLAWRTGRQTAQTISVESIAIPRAAAPKRMYIMPWGLTPEHVALLAPNFPEDYTRLGMNMVSLLYVGHWSPVIGVSPETTEQFIQTCENLANQARQGNVFLCYNDFFPYAPTSPYGMWSWMSDPDARAVDVDNHTIPGWLNGYVPCPSYRGHYYQEAVSVLANSSQLRRAPANFFNLDTEYYGSGQNGTKVCFCARCVALFQSWFAQKYPGVAYVDPFTIQRSTVRPSNVPFDWNGMNPADYQVTTPYPVQYQAWVEFKIEQYADMFAGFKQAIASAAGPVKTSPFDGVTFADWVGLYPFLCQRESEMVGPYSLAQSINVTSLGLYGPPGFLSMPTFQQYLDYGYGTVGNRRCVYSSPATSAGAYATGGYDLMPEHARYYLLETAMHGVQGILLFPYAGLEGKQMQLNAQVFNAFAMVDDILTQGDRMTGLQIQGNQMHASGLQLGDERVVLVGDYYVATDTRTGTLTVPVGETLAVYDLLTHGKLGEVSPAHNQLPLVLSGLNDRARFLYIGKNWSARNNWSAPATLFSAGFESGEGYTTGPLVGGFKGHGANQQGWYGEYLIYLSADANAAVVTTERSHGGTQSLRIPAEDYFYDIYRHAFPARSDGIVTVQWYQLLENVNATNMHLTNNLFVLLDDWFNATDYSQSEHRWCSWSSPYGSGGPWPYTDPYWGSRIIEDTWQYPKPDASGNALMMTQTGISAAGQWKGFRLVINLEARTYDVYTDVDDSEVFTRQLQGVGFSTENPWNGVLSTFSVSQLSHTGYGTYFIGPTGTFVDDILVTWQSIDAGAVPAIHGTVVPQGYTGDVRNVGLRVEFRQGGSVVRTAWVFPDAAGEFLVENIPAGTYDIAVKAYAHLQRVVSGVSVALPPPTELGMIRLIGGDFDGDNEISSTDLSVVLADVGLMGE